MEKCFIELFLRGLVLCLLTAMTLLLLRRAAAAYRHLICVLALAGMLILPLAQRLVPPLRIQPPHSAAITERAAVSQQATDGLSGITSNSEIPSSSETPLLPIRSVKPANNDPAGGGLAPQDNAALARAQSRDWRAYTSAFLLAIWGLGAATLLMRLMVALFRLHRMMAESRKEMLAGVSVLIGDRIETPLTWGIRRPIILLPAGLLSGDPGACESAMRHEQAHVARWDWVWNLLAEVVCALCWIQPGAWCLRSRMRLESERACDDRVLLSGVAGPDYADHLLKILQSRCTREIAPAMAQCGGMEERVKHILDAAKPRRTQTKWLAISALAALALLPLSAVRVSARSAKAKSIGPGAKESTYTLSGLPITQLPPNYLASSPTVSNPTLTKTEPSTLPAANALHMDSQSLLRLGSVTWGKAEDGLEPGLVLTTPGVPNNRNVPQNSSVSYKALVRNRSSRERIVELRCVSSNSLDVPGLIPDDSITTALSGRVIPAKYIAANLEELFESPSAFDTKLAPGETVVVPCDLSLYIGDADKQRYPRVESAKPGKNWIVQPLRIRRLTADEVAEVVNTFKSPVSPKQPVILLDRGAGSDGKQLYANIQFEI